MKLGYSIGISTKLIVVVTAIIIGAIGAVIYIATDLFMEESSNRIQINNKDAVLHSSQKIQKTLEDSLQQMKLMAQMVADQGFDSPTSHTSIQRILSGFDHILSFHVYSLKSENKFERQFSGFLPTVLSELDISEKQFTNLPEKNIFKEFFANKEKEVFLIHTAPDLRRPIFSLVLVSRDKDKTWLFRSDIRNSVLLASLPDNSEITSYIINSKGDVLTHSLEVKRHKALSGLSYQEKSIVQHATNSKINNHQMNFSDMGDDYLGAYRKLDFFDLTLVSQVSHKQAMATIEQVQYRSFLVMIIVICFAFFINYSFSRSLTRPLENLYHATEKIVEGNFDVRIPKTSSDELGALTLAFNGMAGGLKEREKIKSTFAKFHSKEIAQKLLSGEIKLGGERKLATILFSDIRGFTSMSESMSPDQVVSQLNEYLSEMVRIIFKWNGVVDKYIGDAIMAVWGVPETGANDAYNAVRCALEMRDFMKDFNKKRISEGKDPLYIGIGLHSGDVLAGNIGCEQRLEYTCIGDSVNQSSRVEAATKALEADILVSHATYTLVNEKGIEAGPQLDVRAKGKKEALRVHRLIGYMDDNKVLKTSLSEEELVKYRSTHISDQHEEEKISLVGPLQEKTMIQTTTNLIDSYFVVTNINTNEQEGPYSLEELRLKMAQGDFNPQTAFVYKEGDSQVTPLADFSGVNRRQKVAPIQAPPPPMDLQNKAFSNEWYICGPKGETLGPYSFEDLEKALDLGHIHRTTYVWKVGMEEWTYLHKISGFDRRSA